MTTQQTNLAHALAAEAVAKMCDVDTAQGANQLINTLIAEDNGILHRLDALSHNQLIDVYNHAGKLYSRCCLLAAQLGE